MSGLKVCKEKGMNPHESKGMKRKSYEHLALLGKTEIIKNFAPFNIELSALYLPSQYEELQFSHQGTRFLRLAERGVLTDARTVRSGARGHLA